MHRTGSHGKMQIEFLGLKPKIKKMKRDKKLSSTRQTFDILIETFEID